MYGWLLSNLVVWGGAIAGLRYPLLALNIYVALAVLRPQFLFSFAGDLSGLSRVVGISVLLGWALKRFGSWQLGRAKPVVVLFGTFLVWYLISSMLALRPERSFDYLNELAKVALPFFVGLTLMSGTKDWRTTLWTLVLAQGYVGFEMNLNYLFKGYNSALIGFGGMDNNCFAVSLVTLLGPALALMLSTRSWSGRALAALCAALMLHTIMLTYSRGAMIGLAAVGIVALVMMPKRPSYLAGLLVVALFAARFTGPELLARYASAFASSEERDGSAQSRVDLWADCMRVVGDFPAFGVGPANWQVIASQYGWPAGKSAHSVWMESAAELGVVGAGVLLLFFLATAATLWPVARQRITDQNRDEVVLASGVILAIVGFVVAGQFVSIPALEPPYYMVMLGAAMLKNLPRKTAPKVVPQSNFRIAARIRVSPQGVRPISSAGLHGGRQ